MQRCFIGLFFSIKPTVKGIAMDLEIDQGQWSRIWSNGAHFPTEKLTQFMDLCNNEIPLRWLALKRGYGLYRLKTVLEIENEGLRKELEKVNEKYQTVKDFMKEVKS